MADINIDVYTGFLFARDERSPAAEAAEGTFRADVNHTKKVPVSRCNCNAEVRGHFVNLTDTPPFSLSCLSLSFFSSPSSVVTVSRTRAQLGSAVCLCLCE